MAIPLLQMSEQSAVAQQAGSAGWTIPMEYGVVHELIAKTEAGSSTNLVRLAVLVGLVK